MKPRHAWSHPLRTRRASALASHSARASAGVIGGPSVRSGPATVLLAVADADIRCSLRDHLAAQGFSVFATGDARVALDWSGRKAADVVVADVLLPGTRIAIPHVLRRRGRDRCPTLVGLVDSPSRVDEQLRTALGYDMLFSRNVPAPVLTKTLLDLQRAGGPS